MQTFNFAVLNGADETVESGQIEAPSANTAASMAAQRYRARLLATTGTVLDRPITVELSLSWAFDVAADGSVHVSR